MRSIREGDSGPEVADIQGRLGALGYVIDVAERASFGPSTGAAVRAFQAARSLRVDGLVGADTWGQLVEASWRLGDRTLYQRAPVHRGDDVRELQRKLNSLGFDAGREDGLFGPRTETAVREFQRNVGHEPDGMVGNETLRALDRLRPVGASGAVIREEEALREMGEGIAGKLIAIDPGHGPDDPGDTGPDGTIEAEVNYALASALADELASLGAKPAMLRSADEDPAPSIRARLANELGAAACVSLHLNTGEPSQSGPTCSCFGSATARSPMGERLARLILEQLEAELGRQGRLERLTATMLRETRMPAVQVEPVFLTNPEEERLLLDPAFAGRVAGAIAAGVAAFFAG